jgi:hypothetical protein
MWKPGYQPQAPVKRGPASTTHLPADLPFCILSERLAELVWQQKYSNLLRVPEKIKANPRTFLRILAWLLPLVGVHATHRSPCANASKHDLSGSSYDVV